ncbi:hypothetical protein DMTZ50_0006 [Dehalococcoides mccartyi]|nr:hypothetical protein [Dehalococcoides mccartyi]
MASLNSNHNLKLAWIRSLSGSNTYYRNLQRIEIDAFGWAEEDNLQQLQKEISGNSYTPKPTIKIYNPKLSGLLRPLTLLDIRDTILYQAISNLLAAKVRNHLEPFYYKSTFSNILNATDTPYFYRDWAIGYKKLNATKKRAFSSGYNWLGELDLVSFYDLIDHGLLKEILKRIYGEDDILDILFSCLSEWTINHDGLSLKHSHGIPQGPLPSSFLAECVLNTLDKQMTKYKNVVYMRYVDNITIMATNETDAMKLFSHIEIICRDLGLVPQIKRPIQKLNNIDSLIFTEPSILENLTGYSTNLSKAQSAKARSIFLECFRRGEIDKDQEHVVTKLNYSLFRMNPDKRVLNKALSLVNFVPCVSNATHYYLKRFGENQNICNYLLKYLTDSPIYVSVIAECLETISICCNYGNYNRFHKICIKYLSKKYHAFIRSTAVKVLGTRKIHIKPMQRILTYTDDIYIKKQLLVTCCNSLKPIEKELLLNTYIKNENSSIALISAFLIASNNFKLTGNQQSINAWATPILKNAGLTKKRISGDRIGEILQKRYKIVLCPGFSFRNILRQKEYHQALIHLNMAEGNFVTNRSLWVTQMDCFNQILLWKVYKKVGLKVKIGNEFASISATVLTHNFSNIAAVFKDCHDLRSSNQVSHAFSKSLGTYSQDIKIIQREKLHKNLKIAYQEFVDKI